MVADDDRGDGPQRQHERSTHSGPCRVGGEEEEIDGAHREREADRLVGVLGVEPVELRARRIDEHTDAARTRRVGGALDHEEDAEHDDDADHGEDDQLVDHEWEARDPLGGGGRQLEPGVVRTDRKDRIRGKQGVAVEDAGEGPDVVQFVEAVQEQGLEHDVRGEEPEAENDRDEDALPTRRVRAQEAPRTRPELQRDAEQEERVGRGPVAVAGHGVREPLQQKAGPGQCDDRAEARPLSGRLRGRRLRSSRDR